MPKHERRLTPVQEREQERIRVALNREIGNSSLREVARQVDMTPTGLRGFLDGTVPYGPTLIRLRDWYYRWQNGSGLTTDDVDAVVHRLLRRLPDPAAGVAAVTDVIANLHRAANIAAPPWLEELRSRYAPACPPGEGGAGA